MNKRLFHSSSAKLLKVLLLAGLFFSFTVKHPFYISVTEIKHNPKTKSLETSVKIFINDFEEALRKVYEQKVDLINSHGKEREGVNKLVIDYLKSHFLLKTDGADRNFELLGFEREEDAVWIYLEYKGLDAPKSIEIENSILYDFISNQVNIVNCEIKGSKKSAKVSYPEKILRFEF